LNANKDKFKGEIIGIGGGAGLHRNTIKAIDVYDLDYDQVTQVDLQWWLVLKSNQR
jgi:glycine betaine/proline transport system substrate-binding protein